MPYRVEEREFASREDAAASLILTHLARKSLTDVGKCEVAVSLEPRLRPLARERRSIGGGIGGRGGKAKAGDKDLPDPAGPSGVGGSLVEELLAAHGV